VRMSVVVNEVQELECLVNIGWVDAGARGEHVRQAIRRLYAPKAQA